MRVRVEIDDNLKQPELIIRASSDNPNVEKIKELLAATPLTDEVLSGFKNSREYFLKPSSILFIETENRQLQIHTIDEIYTSNERLYEIAEELPDYFLQVAKSTIVNLKQINALNKSISNCLISFYDSPKEVYASRRYYKQLQERLNEMRLSK